MGFKSIKMKLSLKLSDEERICNVLGLLFLGLYIVNITPGFEIPLGIPHAVTSTIVKIILITSFFSCIDVIFRRFKKDILIYCLITATVIFANAVVFPSNNLVFKSTVIYYISNCFLPMIFFGMVHDFQCLKKKLLKASKVILILTVLVLLFTAGAVSLKIPFSLGFYSMGFGYACLVPCLLWMMEFSKKASLKNGLYTGIFLLAIVSLGSRSPMAGILVFAVIAFVKINHEKRKDARIMLGILAGIILIALSGPLFTFMYVVLREFGIRSRNLELFYINDFRSMSGREGLYHFFLHEILTRPFTIRGINGDQALGVGYPHNLFLELLFQFGVAFGGAIIVIIILKARRILKHRYTSWDAKQQLEFVFMCASLGPLMISGTLWTQINFWIWIAISNNKYSSYKKKNQVK